MNKEQIEQAAKQAIHEHYNCNGKFPCVYKDECMYHNGHNTSYDCAECGADNFNEGFIKGASWRINSVWHRTNERPENGRLILCIRGGGALALISGPNNSQFCKYSYEYGFEYWAYVEDLLPNTQKK